MKTKYIFEGDYTVYKYRNAKFKFQDLNCWGGVLLYFCVCFFVELVPLFFSEPLNKKMTHEKFNRVIVMMQICTTQEKKHTDPNIVAKLLDWTIS